MAATIPLSLGLTACGQERVRLVPVPVELTTCAGEPVAPDLPVQDWSSIEAAKAVQAIRDSKVFEFILAMRSAWGDCRAKVDGTKAYNESLK